ncbi:hypothetical protein [Micromonospora sp. CA-244673]|uniref:hypothetical protein n=1 Tax=Micromonospora sp. CA-244673 TaxID=3239958 RepID=UPI003D91B48E
MDDQKLGAGIAWASGEIPAALVMILLVRRWIDADRRKQRRLDRAADRDEDDGLARYDAFLAAAGEQDSADRSPAAAEPVRRADVRGPG